MIAATISAAKKYGINRITRDIVALEADCCPSLINYYFGSMCELINRAAWQGVADDDIYFIRQLISINHEAAKDLKLAIVKKTRV